MQIREPAVAGSFYPADPRVLQRDVSEFLEQASQNERLAGGDSPKAVIVPHAGYVYSGAVAASAYAALSPLRGRVRRVVLLGPAHRVALRGLAVLPVDAMRTPLGLVPVDREASSALRDLPQVTTSGRAHALEHSLEVQLPFLQMTLGEFSVVPLVVGDASDEEVASVLERLWGGPETLFVISSDLSHYHDDATARALDRETCHAIESLDPEALDWESACGRIPVRGLLRVARRHGLTPRTLDLRNSGETAGGRDSVVGYGAWSFSAPSESVPDRADPSRGSTLESGSRATSATSAEDARLLTLARESIAHGLANGKALPVDPRDFPGSLGKPGAAFVTLRDEVRALRGCIGSLEPHRSLVEDVCQNAWAAAFRDFRFPPVHASEFSRLHIHVSILEPPEALAARSLEALLAALTPEVDGLILEDGGRRATFLPQVWESVANAREFIALLWQKAGLPPDHWSETTRAWRYRTRSIDEPIGR
jgi:AmmeMemoRadiSam system protein B/AmmeMemoRadiSam system protein A